MIRNNNGDGPRCTFLSDQAARRESIMSRAYEPRACWPIRALNRLDRRWREIAITVLILAGSALVIAVGELVCAISGAR